MQRPSDESTLQLDNVLPEFLARVNDLERRVAALENRSAPPVVNMAPVAVPEFPQIPAGIIPTVGTAMLGLAGAYLLRALAESGAAPRIAIVAAALVYAGAWLAWSIRPRATETFRTSVYAITAALIFAPLLWETTLRFQILSPAEAALILVLFVAAGYALAWRRELGVVSRITTITAAGTALGLLLATRDLAPFTLALLATALLEEYAACRDRNLGDRWIAALACDVSLLILATLTSRPQGLPEGYSPISTRFVVVTQFAALAIYVANVSFRTLVRGLTITWFEVSQATLIFAISMDGILGVTRGAAGPALGCFCVLTGVAAYLAAFLLVDRRTERRNLHTYSFWGLTLLLAGTAFLCSGGVLTAIWGALAILAMYQGRRAGQIILRAHACVYLIGAALASGLVRYCYAVSIEPQTPWSAVAPAAILAAFAAALCYAASGVTSTLSMRIPAAILAVVLCWSVLAFGSGALAELRIDVAALATLRTALLCAVAVGIALAGSRWGRGELVWLQYPVMLIAAAKLLLEDLRIGSPAGLAISLLAYGGALILLPRCRPGAQKQRAT